MVIAIIKKAHLLVKVGVIWLYSLIGESAPLWWGGIGSEPVEATLITGIIFVKIVICVCMVCEDSAYKLLKVYR